MQSVQKVSSNCEEDTREKEPDARRAGEHRSVSSTDEQLSAKSVGQHGYGGKELGEKSPVQGPLTHDDSDDDEVMMTRRVKVPVRFYPFPFVDAAALRTPGTEVYMQLKSLQLDARARVVAGGEEQKNDPEVLNLEYLTVADERDAAVKQRYSRLHGEPEMRKRIRSLRLRRRRSVSNGAAGATVGAAPGAYGSIPAGSTLPIFLTYSTKEFRSCALTQVAPEDVLLEVGCSTGMCTAMLMCKNLKRQLAVDVSHEMVEATRKHCEEVAAGKPGGDSRASSEGLRVPEIFFHDVFVQPGLGEVLRIPHDEVTVLLIDIGGQRDGRQILMAVERCLVRMRRIEVVVIKSEALVKQYRDQLPYTTCIGGQDSLLHPLPQDQVQEDGGVSASRYQLGTGISHASEKKKMRRARKHHLDLNVREASHPRDVTV
eukprot:3549814-Rhodomonas_salina.1